MKAELSEERLSRLDHEHKVYQAISGSIGVPQLYWYGREGIYNILVIERLGNTLEELKQGNKLDTDSIFYYGGQMVRDPVGTSCTQLYFHPPSSLPLNLFTSVTLFIVTSNLIIS